MMRDGQGKRKRNGTGIRRKECGEKGEEDG